MGTERPGRAAYVTATKATRHNAAVVEGNGKIVGQAVKTKAASWSAGLDAVGVIAQSEDFTIRTKGIHQFPNTGITGAGVGDYVFIATADNALSLTKGAGKVPFGQVVEKPGVRGRGVPAGFLRIDLDQKDQAPAA